MPVYRLSPVEHGKSHRDWSTSVYCGPCHVSAENEGLARLYARTAFGIATKRDSGRYRFSAWGQPELVDCIEMGIGGELSDGMVTVPAETGMPDFLAKGPNAGAISKR